MLRRKIDKTLKEWKNKENKRPLIVQGVRQVGKTTSVRLFGKECYSEFFELNFIRTPIAKEAFIGDLSAESILSRLSLLFSDFHIEKGSTLLFLDEIQECPEARAALKFLADADGIDVIASGSLLGVRHKNVVSYPVGYVEYVTMKPLDFEEFLWANEIPASIIQIIHDSFVAKGKVDDFIHERLMELFRTYIVVGGMPHVVERYVERKNFSEVLEIQRDIMHDYELDIIRYAEGSEKQRIRACFLSIPRQLAKENRKFQYSVVEKGSTSRKYGQSILWLSDADVALFSYNIAKLELPLKAYEEEDDFRLYLCDTGLLVSQYEDGTARDIISGNIGAYKGAIYENMIAQMLSASGHSLHFFKPSQKLEIDFVIRFSDAVCPIEVKSSINTRSKSLSTILSSEKYGIDKTIRLSPKNVGDEGGICSLPLYMAFLL